MSNNTTRRCNSQYHVGNRVVGVELFTSSHLKNACKHCISKMRKREREKNKARVKREQEEWRKANKEYLSQKNKEYRSSERGKQIRQQSYERNREQKRKYDKNRRQNVPGVREKYNATSAKYRAAKLKATPLWFEKEKVELLYVQSKLLTESTGTKHNVDHIVPLQGELVCGLHCLDNLQVIPALDNISKSNSFQI